MQIPPTTHRTPEASITQDSVLFGRAGLLVYGRQPVPRGIFWALVWVLFWLQWAWAAPAGTIIRNQAKAIVNGQVYLSNEVETLVQAVCVPSITPNGSLTSPGQSTTTPAGGTAYFSYRLQNLGNKSFTFSLSSLLQSGPPWTPNTVRFYLDSNANAQLDSGEPAVSSLTLDMDQEARLILAVETPPSASGELLIGPVATCPDGTRDEDNYSLIRIGTGPALSLVKSVDTRLVRRGQEVGFSLQVLNLGGARAAGPVYVEDRLDIPELSGLVYVSGSASAVKGRLEYSSDGQSWSSNEPSTVKGIRLVLDGLEAGEEAVFSFQMRVVDNATPGERSNLARVTSSEGGAQTQVSLRIAAEYAHALGPIGNPQAVGAADRQEAEVLAGQPYCFAHTLLNTGNAADIYTLEAVGLPAGVNLTYHSMSGGGLPLPITLGPGDSLDFKACLPALPAGTPAFEFTLLARSSKTGNADPTLDRVTRVWDLSEALLLEKQVQPRNVRVGDLLTYTVTAVNVGRVPLTVRLEDTPNPSLQYQAGSATPREPLQENGRLVWKDLPLDPGERVEIRYRMRVLATTGGELELKNTVQAIGKSAGAAGSAGATAVASAVASASVRIEQGALAVPHLLLGRVFLDTDRDGRYTAGVDIPLPGARVVLSDGRQALTDAEGRYSFRNVAGGVWGVRLDPASAPFPPLPHPEAQKDGYQHRVRVEGLTVSDFPLERPVGLARAQRQTVLEFGPLRLSKHLLPLPAGFRVVLVLESKEPLEELTLTDPLPDGGERVFRFDRFQGRETLTYDLEGTPHLTDPQVRWRYP